MSSVNTQPVCDMPINDDEKTIFDFRRDIQELLELVRKHETLLYGDGGRFGLAQKMQIVWRAWIWLLCTVSGLAGYVLHALLPLIKP